MYDFGFSTGKIKPKTFKISLPLFSLHIENVFWSATPFDVEVNEKIEKN